MSEKWKTADQVWQVRLPSQRQLYQPGWEWKVMVLDVGEVEIERPQKNSKATTVASRSVTR
jgi:hypothetical protein